MDVPRHVLKTFFERSTTPLVQHHVDSYNDLIEVGIPTYIRKSNPFELEVPGNRIIRIYIGGKEGTKLRFESPKEDDGAAIVPHACRLDMPFNEGPYDRWRVYAAFSDDGGDSWRIGAVAPNAPKGLGNEVQMFERADGAVVLNARQHLGAKRRTAAVSTDGGATWSQLADVPELPDPQCMGGVLALGGGTVVFTGCDSESRRALGTVWISRDDGRSWPEKMLVEPGGFAYSVPIDLGLGADGARMIGVLHEGAGYKRIEFARVSLPSAPPAATPPVR